MEIQGLGSQDDKGGVLRKGTLNLYLFPWCLSLVYPRNVENIIFLKKKIIKQCFITGAKFLVLISSCTNQENLIIKSIENNPVACITVLTIIYVTKMFKINSF